MIKSRVLYAAIIVAAFIFSQALYDSISLFTLVCVLLLPIVSVVLLLVGKNTVHVQCRLQRREIYRYQTNKLYIEIQCGVPFISPIMRLNCQLPNEEKEQSTESYLHISFSPMSKTVIEVPFEYDFRGVYTVGVQNIELCDFLRLVKIKKKIGTSWTLRVLPRFLPSDLQMQQQIYLDDGSGADMMKAAGYAAEMLGVRDYIEDEPLRHVHWNLSAQKDKLMVKNFAAARQKQAYIFVDLSDAEPSSQQSRRLGDAMVESALSLTRDYMNQIGATCLMWNGGDLVMQDVDTPQQLAAAHAAIAMCPMQSLRKMDEILDKIGSVQHLCVIVGRLSQEKMRRIEVLQIAVQCPIRLLAFENTGNLSAELLRGKNITLEMLNLSKIEEGRLA